MQDQGKGIFITFEGVEGSGKSTQIELLSEYLRGKGYEVVATREPGGTNIGESIRDILLDPDFLSMDSYTELFLYVASRAQLACEVIKPALDTEKVVLCDRFADSSLAYQGFGRDIPLDKIEAVNEWATQGLCPQLTIVLSIPAQDGLVRATGDSADRIEREPADFHERVKNGYEKIAQRHPDRIHTIDGTGNPSEIHRSIVKLVDELLSKEENCQCGT